MRWWSKKCKLLILVQFKSRIFSHSFFQFVKRLQSKLRVLPKQFTYGFLYVHHLLSNNIAYTIFHISILEKNTNGRCFFILYCKTFILFFYLCGIMGGFYHPKYWRLGMDMVVFFINIQRNDYCILPHSLGYN